MDLARRSDAAHLIANGRTGSGVFTIPRGSTSLVDALHGRRR
jgi:hypothetical protein